MRTRRKAAVLLFVVIYVGSYVALSRRGFAAMDRDDGVGFYYFEPVDTPTWRIKNRVCTYLFLPLNFIDQLLGTGRGPASEPMFKLS